MIGVQFTVILPPELKASIFTQMLTQEAKVISLDIAKDFQNTVKTWAKKPAFKIENSVSGNKLSIRVSTTDKVYNIVSKGSKPRPFIPGKKVFKISTGYQPKTRSGILGANSGASAGFVYRRATQLPHPGVKARQFDVQIVKKWQPIVARRLQAKLNLAADSSGHPMPFGTLGPCKFQQALGVTGTTI